jgi:hypothetical protein
MTKLYAYLNEMQSDIWSSLGAIVFLQVITLWIVVFLSFNIFDWQELHTAIDTARINIREDIVNLDKKIDSKFGEYYDQLDVIQWRTDWIADNIKPSHSWVTNVSNIQLVHYIAEVEICSDKHSSYKVKVDFYWINPRIESNRLLILDERLFSSYEAYDVYLPIYDKNTDYDANLCSIKILSSSNK